MLRRLVLLGALCAAATPALAQAPSCTPRVPDSELIKSRTLVMSTNPTLPPLQFVDSTGQLRGMRIELGNEIARRLCLTPEYVRIEFSAMIPGLAARRWDMINTGIFYTEERARMMQMIRYENQAIAISAPRGNPQNITRVEDLAGRAVAVEIGGFEERRIREISTDLQARGMRPLNIRTFDNFALAYQALRAGQVEATVSIDGVAAEYAQRGEFPRVIHGLFPTPVSLAFRSRVVADAVRTVLDEMRADGSLPTLFDRFGANKWQEAFTVAGPN
jgi:polar amino acid transport system substrate-binding protein